MCSMDIIRGAAAVATFGGSEAVIYGANKALDAINPAAKTVNSRGDELTDDMKAQLDAIKDPSKRADVLLGWLTGGPKPTAPDPGVAFGDAAKVSGVQAKGAAGQGIAGLFGAGLMVGDLVPKTAPIQPGSDGGPGMDLQRSVPYAAPALPSFKLPDGGPPKMPGGS